jgi:glycosyltransferase involved in cell wall biosynthesis
MLMNYYRQMDRSKIQFDFIVHRQEEGHYDREIEVLGGRLYRLPAIRPGGYRLYFRLLDQFFQDYPNYKVVHSHINENSSFVMRAARKAGVPCRIMHSHLSDHGLDYKLPFRLYARWAMRDHPSSYFACSRNAGRWLFGSRMAASDEMTVMNNAVDVARFLPDASVRAQCRNELGAGDRLVVGHVGRFQEQKNHEFLLDIFKAILVKEPNALLVLAGEGHLRPMIERKIDRLGLRDNVKLLGVCENVARLLQGVDIFLFPSLYEGLPVVLVEAQAAGLSCIVSDAITTESDLTGLVSYISLKQPPDAWADAVLTAPREHRNMAEALARHGYDTTTMVKWLSDYYLANAAAAVSG